MIVRETDCCAGTGREIPGMVVKAFMEGREEIESLQERITGRFSRYNKNLRNRIS